MLSKKNVSIAMIGLLILPLFITVPISTAYGSTYIAVNPLKVRSGDDVYVRGYNFNSYQPVDVYWNTTDDYNYLGSAQADAWGRFSFKFLMQETYPGVYDIIVITNPDVYTAEIKVIATSPLDQRLVDLINALSVGFGDIEGTLNDIYTEVISIEAKLDEGGSFYTFVDEWFNTIQTNISDVGQELYQTIIDAKSDIVSEINSNELKIDEIEAKLDEGGSFYTFVDEWFNDIQGNTSNGVSGIIGNITEVKYLLIQNLLILDDVWSLTDNIHGWANLTEAMDDIKDEIITIDDVVNDINSTVDETDYIVKHYIDLECLEVEIQTVERNMDLNLVGGEWADYFFSTNIGGSDYQSDVYVITSLRGQRVVPTSIYAHVKDGNMYEWNIDYYTIDDYEGDIKDVYIYTDDAVEPGSYLVIVDVEYDDLLSGLSYYGTGSYIIECTETILLE